MARATSLSALTMQGLQDPPPAQAIDEADLLAWQFKRQQEQAALESDTLECTQAAWADPHLLKHQINGLQNVRWR